MGLLDGGSLYEPCIVYPEEMVLDGDGNKRTRPAATGIPTTARFQVQGQSGTSARRAEQDNEGFETEQVYEVRFPRSFVDRYGLLGAQSELEWGLNPLGHPVRWAIFGYAAKYNSSRRTAHTTYAIKRF